MRGPSGWKIFVGLAAGIDGRVHCLDGYSLSDGSYAETDGRMSGRAGPASPQARTVSSR